MENVKKRQRALNFTPSETLLLMDTVFKFQKIIKNKKTDTITNKKKDAAWIKIADLFNAANGVTIRSAKTLKLKYESIKKSVKKKAAQNRQESTSGVQATLSVEEEKVLAMCANIDGLETWNDSDSTIASTSGLFIPDAVEETRHTIPFDESLYDSKNAEQMVPNIKKEINDNEGGSCSTWETVTPEALETKANPALEEKLTKTRVSEELDRSRIELVELQKQIARNELKYKQIEHELHVQQKKEEHELRILYLHNDEKRKEIEHKFHMRKFKK